MARRRMMLPLPLSARAIAACGLVLLAAGTHWAAYKRGGKAVQAQWHAAQAQASAVALQATKANAARQVRQIDNVLEATNAQAHTAQRLRTDADRARTELDRLRNTLATTARGSDVPATSACTANAAANALGELLAASGERLAAMAAAADAHALDAATCHRAWPRE